MSDFKRKNNNNFWHSPFVLVVLFCFVVLFFYNIVGLFKKERETSKKKELILFQIENLREKENKLNLDIEKLKTEEGIEETIRDKYQVVKEGEKMVVIVDDEMELLDNSLSENNNHTFWGWIKKTFGL